jgi:hypothetical protein
MRVCFLALLQATIGNAAFLCFNYFSSDDCSGDPKVTPVCVKDGECAQWSPLTSMNICLGGGNGWIEQTFSDKSCGSISYDTSPNVRKHVCTASTYGVGTATMNTSCTDGLPPRHRLLSDLDKAERAALSAL